MLPYIHPICPMWPWGKIVFPRVTGQHIFSPAIPHPIFYSLRPNIKHSMHRRQNYLHLITRPGQTWCYNNSLQNSGLHKWVFVLIRFPSETLHYQHHYNSRPVDICMGWYGEYVTKLLIEFSACASMLPTLGDITLCHWIITLASPIAGPYLGWWG